MCKSCDWETHVDDAEAMVADIDDAYDYAEETLSGIISWVRRKKHITENQIQSIENIAGSPSNDKF